MQTLRFPKVLPLLVALGAPLLGGCGSLLDDRCEVICGCEDCGEREQEECTTQVEADFAVAEAYDCVELIEPYWECQLDRHECEDGRYSDDNNECGEALQQYFECLDAKSTRRPGPY